jgi:hypothetical protein
MIEVVISDNIKEILVSKFVKHQHGPPAGFLLSFVTFHSPVLYKMLRSDWSIYKRNFASFEAVVSHK